MIEHAWADIANTMVEEIDLSQYLTLTWCFCAYLYSLPLTSESGCPW